MSSSRGIVTDLPKELRHMLGEDEEVYYKGKTKRYAPGGEPVQPTEIFVTNQKIILYNHKFFGTIEDLHYGDILNSKMKKGIFSCHIELKSKFPENDTIVATQHAITTIVNAPMQIPGFNASNHTTAIALSNLGFPLTGSMAAGFTLGFVRG
jgi:hypothetical protein